MTDTTYAPDRAAPSLARRRLCWVVADESNPGSGEPSHGFAAGTWGRDFHPEFGPHPGDVVVLEHWGQSGFASASCSPC